MLTYNGANALLGLLVGVSGGYSYPNVYVGLSKTAPSRDGTGVTEPSAEYGYSRVLLGRNSSSSGSSSVSPEVRKMSTPELGATTNKDFVYFPEATGSWGTCTHFTIWSAAEEGVLVAYGALTNSISPTNGTVPIIRIGDLDMSIS